MNEDTILAAVIFGPATVALVVSVLMQIFGGGR